MPHIWKLCVCWLLCWDKNKDYVYLSFFSRKNLIRFCVCYQSEGEEVEKVCATQNSISQQLKNRTYHVENKNKQTQNSDFGQAHIWVSSESQDVALQNSCWSKISESKMFKHKNNLTKTKSTRSMFRFFFLLVLLSVQENTCIMMLKATTYFKHESDRCNFGKNVYEVRRWTNIWSCSREHPDGWRQQRSLSKHMPRVQSTSIAARSTHSVSRLHFEYEAESVHRKAIVWCFNKIFSCFISTSICTRDKRWRLWKQRRLLGFLAHQPRYRMARRLPASVPCAQRMFRGNGDL